MRWTLVLVAATATANAQPAPELPAPPSFELAAPEAGTSDVRMLRIRGKAMHGQNLRVRGYVTWAYDCKKALAKPGLSDRRIRKMIEKDPSVCAKGQLRLGATKDAGEGRSILVIQEAAAIPAVNVGDHVSITGTWKPGDRGEVGQLALASLVAVPPSAAVVLTATPAAAAPAVVVPTRPAARPVADAVRTTSQQDAVAGNKALASRQPDEAVAAYTRAVGAWDGNHAAWYALGVAHVQKRDWAAARTAWERAASLVPDNALYQQWLGIATYESSPADRRDGALRALRIATRIDAKAWRAHYTLGRLHRDADRPRDAADALMRAITAAPKEAGPFVALAELYRRWDHHDHAISVATAGVAQTNDSELWYVLGTAYDDKRQDDKALEAFGKALERRADNAKAKFARGRVLHRKGDRVRAKLDLDEFVKVAPPELDVQKRIAIELMK